MNEYEVYKKSLGNIPEFMKKYLELDIVKRLKGISLLCGMDYASKAAYDFPYYISRYDHSVNVALITWKLTHEKTATIAALFHDISTPVFSHVIDYFNNDLVNQESTEELTGDILRESIELNEYLKEDDIDLEDVINFKKFSIVDIDRPGVCADRIDGTICSAINWTKSANGKECASIIDDLIVSKNEKGVKEIAFKSIDKAELFTRLNDEINRETHTNNDNYMMNLLSDIVRISIEENITDYKSLFYITERELIECIEDNLDLNEELKKKWNLFKSIKEIPVIEMPVIKNKIINPLVVDKRLKKML